jgi:hypothetical protein
MTYSAGNLIVASDFNGFASTNVGANLNATLSFYGQSNISTVSPGAVVSATNWATLNGNITLLANQQGTTITSRVNPVAGNTITILSNLNTDLTNIYTNRQNASTSGAQYTTWTGTASKTSATGSGGASWTITFTDTVTFANATAATNFWNSGGLVKIEFSKSSTGTDADPDWNNFANTICGDVYISGDAASKTIANTVYTGTTVIGGTGTPTTLTTGTGWNQLTANAVTVYKQFNSSYIYTNDYIEITASKSSTVLNLTITWFSALRDFPGASRNISGGTATTGISFGTAPATVVTYFPPSSTYLTNVWGTPTVASSVS